MSLLERTIDFLRDNAPAGFCDDCLDQILDLQPGQAERATAPLGMTEFFRRDTEICDACRGKKTIVRHVEEPEAHLPMSCPTRFSPALFGSLLGASDQPAEIRSLRTGPCDAFLIPS